MIFCIAEKLHVVDYLMVSETLHQIDVGRRLRAAIKAKGMTQAQVMRDLGPSASKIGNWLRGDNYPSAWFVKQFCDLYGITTDWIYRGIVSGMDANLATALWKSEQPAPEAKPPAAQAPVPRPRGLDPPRPIAGGNITKLKAIGSGRSSI